jgi:hypothetical protein
MSAQRRRVLYRSREQLAEAMRSAILTNPQASDHDVMARAVGIAPRTLYRLRAKFAVPWPPFDDWDALLRLAAGGQQAPAEPLETTWLVSYTLSEQRWVTATSIDEAIAKLRAEVPRAAITSVHQA